MWWLLSDKTWLHLKADSWGLAGIGRCRNRVWQSQVFLRLTMRSMFKWVVLVAVWRLWFHLSHWRHCPGLFWEQTCLLLSVLYPGDHLFGNSIACLLFLLISKASRPARLLVIQECLHTLLLSSREPSCRGRRIRSVFGASCWRSLFFSDRSWQ